MPKSKAMKWKAIKIILLLVMFLVISGCGVFKKEKFKFYIFNDPEQKYKLFINGKPLSEYERNSESFYAEDYRIYGEDNEVSMQIKAENESVAEQSIKSGTYIVNLSKSHLISYQELAYGRTCFPCKSVQGLEFGIHLLSDKTDVLTFGFEQSPPKEIRVKNGGSLSERTFFKMSVTKK